MLEKPILSDFVIIKCLSTYYAIKAANLTFLPIGADTNASIYKAQAFDQTSYFIKVKQGHHHDIGVEIIELLQRAGIQQIIPPIKTMHGKPTQPIDDFTLIVYPFVEGQDGFSRNLTEDQWVKLGKALKQVHEVKMPLSIQNRIRKETYSPKWRELVRSLYPHIGAETRSDQVALQLQMFMKKNRPAIHRLVDRAEQLGEKLRSLSPKFVLCHSDIHAGNVLIDRNDGIYIVDWDEPVMAPKERDLMFIGGGVGNVWNRPQEENFFYKGYGKTEVDLTILAYYRQERIVEDMAIYAQALLTTAGGNDRQEMYKQFVSMFESRGVVEIAFKTDENLLASKSKIQDV
jgi:spectinomycin phosphotransferase